MKYDKGLFIFHRDLRIIDNTTLIEASKNCHKVYVCFIFTEDQVSTANKFRSIPAISFMIESLSNLSKDLKGDLAFFYGKNEGSILPKIIKDLKN